MGIIFKKAISFLIICLTLTGCSRSVDKMRSQDNHLNVYCFKIGKADAFILYDKNTAVLIDTGETEDSAVITDYLEEKGITRLDRMIITHFDKDHIGGAAGILEKTEVDEIYTPVYVKESEEYDSFLERVNEKKILLKALKENSLFEINGIRIEVNVPSKENYSESPSNNSSLIVRVVYGETSFLFTGDAEELRLREYMASGPEKCDMVKMPYHGNYKEFNGCLEEFIELIKPKYAVITSSKKKKEAEKTKKLLEKKGISLYLTRKGSILFISDGKTISTHQEE